MAEYIDREATIELLRSLGSRDYRREKGTIQEAIKMVSFSEYTPAADVAPVRHGRWMNANSRPKTYWRRCTACGGLAYFCGIGCSYKYCPNCGCLMDGGDDE